MTAIVFISFILATILADATPLIQPPPPPQTWQQQQQQPSPQGQTQPPPQLQPHGQKQPRQRPHRYPRQINSVYASRRQQPHVNPRQSNSVYASRRQHPQPAAHHQQSQPRPTNSLFPPPRQQRKQKIHYTAPVTKKMLHAVSAPGVPVAGAMQFLEAHNKIRLQYKEPPLLWNETLAEEAKKYVASHATSCTNEHTDGPYGENTFWCGRADVFTPEKVVEKWVEEKSFFDSKINDCTGDEECGHFTQLVWMDTKSLGCSMVTCYNGGMVTMCFYYPPGNYAFKSPFQKHLKA